MNTEMVEVCRKLLSRELKTFSRVLKHFVLHLSFGTTWMLKLSIFVCCLASKNILDKWLILGEVSHFIVCIFNPAFQRCKSNYVFFMYILLCLYFPVYSCYLGMCVLYVCYVNMFASMQNIYKNINF